MFALDALAINLDLLAIKHLRPAVNHFDPVLLQQGSYPAGQAVDDAVLPGHALADVQARRSNADAQVRRPGKA